MGENGLEELQRVVILMQKGEYHLKIAGLKKKIEETAGQSWRQQRKRASFSVTRMVNEVTRGSGGACQVFWKYSQTEVDATDWWCWTGGQL